MAPRQSTTSLKQEADDHLRETRRRSGFDGSVGDSDGSMEDLDRAPDLLSDQPHQKNAHFLLELIKNADNNTYKKSVTPTLSFRIANSKNAWCMRIDCNDVNFRDENIEELCRVGHSTKDIEDLVRRTNGDNGIGFKSVFEFADVVHIYSKPYLVRFGRRSVLGIISPIIETFPLPNLIREPDRKVKRKQPQLLLTVLGESEFDGISDELQKLKPQILIFLRKLRKLNVRTPDRDVQFEIQRVDEDQDLDGEETTTLKSTSLHDRTQTEEKYLIVRYPQDSLEEDDLREKAGVTRAVLAFPVDKKGRRPRVHAQDTYAYPPINDYGLNYLIQADFLLVANMEKVDSWKWDDGFLYDVCKAFVKLAVPRFNRIRGSSPRSKSLRYTWPLFLKDRGGSNEFWFKLKRRILLKLSTRNVLECRKNGKLTHPESLLYIPSDFRLDEEPLVENKISKLQHLSFLYDSEIENILPELRRMGVKQMEFSHFYEELDLINKYDDSFLTSQPEEWHSKVAQLFHLHSSRRQATRIPLIPLRDGRWVKPSEPNLFLDWDTTDAEVPDGLNICLVDYEACQDINRLAFFQWVGIKKCDRSEVCRMIMLLYDPFKWRTLRSSVQDIIYLLQAPGNFYEKAAGKLQLIGTTKSCSTFKYANQLYFEYPGRKSIISKYAEHPENPMANIHPMYFEAAQKLGKEGLFFFLAHWSLNMAHLPRLLDEQRLLTPEFDFLRDHALEDMLLLLRDNWDHYNEHFHSRNGEPSRLKKAISEMNVRCIDGNSCRLDQTILPFETLKIAGPNLLFIDIPEPNDVRWLNLSAFGVLTNLCTEFYLRELKALAAHPETESTSKSAVEILYTKLRSCEETQAISEAFTSCRLVYLEKSRRWVYLSECVWNGPREVKLVNKLSSEYPLCRSLFQDCLRLGNVTLDHVIKELKSVTRRTPFRTLQQLLLLLNKYLPAKAPSSCLSGLEGKKIIPVTTPNGEERMSYDADVWYFADKQSLWDRFNGKIPLISFDVKTVRKLNPLISAMDLSKYLLSASVERNLKAVGLKIADKERTDDLRARSRYFVQLIPKETTKTITHLLNRLINLNVWGVPAIKLTQEVHDIKITEDTGAVLFDDLDDTKLEIYFSIKDSQKAITDIELSRKFIRYCDITDRNLQRLVRPILQNPREDIEKLLKDYGLDGSGGLGEEFVNITQSVSEEISYERALVHRVDAGTASSPLMPSSGINTLAHQSSSQVRRLASLGDRIPASDQSISSVRIAATVSSRAPTYNRSNPAFLFNSTSCNIKDSQHSTAGNDTPSGFGQLFGRIK